MKPETLLPPEDLAYAELRIPTRRSELVQWWDRIVDLAARTGRAPDALLWSALEALAAQERKFRK